MPRRLITRSFWLRHRADVMFLTVALLFVFLLIATKVNQDRERRTAELGARSYHALCVLRGYYGEQITVTRTFIRKHPEGIPPSVSVADLRLSLHRLEAIYRGYRSLECPPSV